MVDQPIENTFLNKFLVKNAPPTIFYVPDFLSADEERYLLNRVENAPRPKWQELSNRRLQNWGGVVEKNGLIQENLPDWLKVYVDKLCAEPFGLFPEKNAPNHVLINEYRPGQGIMPHVDGPVYFPFVTNISLGGHTVLNLYENVQGSCGSMDQIKDTGTDAQRIHVGSLLLQPRSLLVIRDEVYAKFLHGISEFSEDVIAENVLNLELCNGVKVGDTVTRRTRVSLTIRNVPRVYKIARFGFAKVK